MVPFHMQESRHLLRFGGTYRPGDRSRQETPDDIVALCVARMSAASETLQLLVLLERKVGATRLQPPAQLSSQAPAAAPALLSDDWAWTPLLRSCYRG